MIVTVQIGPDGRIGVQVLPASLVAEHRSLAAGNDDGSPLEPIPHLRKGVPHITMI
jgi:hypothetical protein